MRMPTQIELEQTFGGAGPAARTRSIHQDLREEEARGRLMRSAQVDDNCRVSTTITATFSGDAAATGRYLTGWIEFGRIRFLGVPDFTTGSTRLAQEGEPTLNPDLSNFNPTQHFVMPCVAQVAGYRWEKGFPVAAKCFIVALGPVPDGFRAAVSAVWSGPGVRME
ncbi:MAG: hypothetical protein M1325_01175 [Actinobacteria bacterium]|nr:hypothetical protein [Actinomycetota bacterium]